VPTLIAATLNEDDPQHFLQAVSSAKGYIAMGDIYQANLARCWHGTLQPGATATDIYRRLRQSNPSPFAGIAKLPGITVVSSSPERLWRSDGRNIETRPIAGTRPRTRASADDETIRRELRAHPKERAEHVMLIDLERNDLGRVCQPGSVAVDEFMVIETYAHVHHIVSNVRGVLREDATPGTIIRSVFPGGSITGCPKVRCMQIISELEGRSRGIYTGAMGYINRDGSADLNILIRTIAVMGDQVTVATGSGIVADSDPEQELEETRAKARGLLLALTGGPELDS
jgi:anthranilate synthase component 1